MNVGILTFHDGINYGAFFQVYVMQKFLLQHGFKCQIINYKSIGFTLREYRCFLKIRCPIQSLINLYKIIKFKKAHQKLPFTKRIFRKRKLSTLSFDRVIIGSDEVWNYGSSLIGYDPVYFSEGIKAESIISYAASFGNRTANEMIPVHLRGLLKQIDYISVRDQNSKNILALINDKPVHVVLDPTFLVNLKSEAITSKERDFILIYGFFNSNMIKKIVRYANLVGKKTVSISYNNPWCDINLNTLSPFQWLGYFTTCYCVVTTMYHGMIFSILNNKEFCMIRTPYRKNKLGNFLTDLGLSGRCIDENESIKAVFSSKIDYSEVKTKVKLQFNQSAGFLLKALQS